MSWHTCPVCERKIERDDNATLVLAHKGCVEKYQLIDRRHNLTAHEKERNRKR